MKKLEYENERLRAENAFFKKLQELESRPTLSAHRQERIYLAIQAVHEQEAFPVQLLCDLAGISRSSYYKWRAHRPSARERENRKLTDALISLYEQVGGIYGYRRLTLHLRRQTEQALNPKRIRR
ncbi:IS3 family transposase [Paenibacillus durus]|uniref:IS3 family transposase n=1 Tax=Paenibacillus durus TaxID=44251 RepID=UPI0009E018BD|nr:IS3 family transposase [Paenibacillus durus]